MIIPYKISEEFIDKDLEGGLLAALVSEPAQYFTVIDLLHEDTFVARRADFLQIATAIEDEKPLPPITDLPAPSADPHSAAKQLAGLYQRRLLADIGQKFMLELRGEGSPDDLKEILAQGIAGVEQASRQLTASRVTSVADLLPEIIGDFKARYAKAQATESGLAGIPTGFPSLDRMLGGLSESLLVLAAPPGFGKTTLALQLAANVCREGFCCLFVSHEEGVHRLAAKVIASGAGLEFKRFEDGLADPVGLEQAAAAQSQGLSGLYFHEGTKKTTVAEIKAKFRQVLKRTGCQSGMIVIDYLQRAASSGSGSGEYRHVLDGYLDQVCEHLVKHFHVPVLMLAAQSRAGSGSGSISSIRDSSGAEYSGDIVALLCEGGEVYTEPKRSVVMVVGKNRRGATGEVQMAFDPAIGAFTETFTQY